jgi:hypothetical protein
MRDDDLIERYLVRLDAELRLPARARRRIIAEARDHLRELAGSVGVESDATCQASAIDAFGAPAVVAERFAYELALGATRRAARSGASMFLLALVLWDLCTSSFIHVAPGWINDGLGTVSLWILGQVGLIAGAVSLARARVARRADGTDTIRLRYIVRGLIVLSICTGVTVAIAMVGVASAATTQGARHDSWVLLAALTLGCVVVTAIGTSATWRASQRLAVFDGIAVTSTGREALLDVLMSAGDGLGYLARRVGLSPRLTRVIAARTRGALRGLAAFDPQEHPWRFATLIALLAGSAVPALNLAVLTLTGKLDSQLGQLATTAPALITVEAALVLAGYATLGRYLGLRPTRTPTSP